MKTILAAFLLGMLLFKRTQTLEINTDPSVSNLTNTVQFNTKESEIKNKEIGQNEPEKMHLDKTLQVGVNLRINSRTQIDPNSQDFVIFNTSKSTPSIMAMEESLINEQRVPPENELSTEESEWKLGGTKQVPSNDSESTSSAPPETTVGSITEENDSSQKENETDSNPSESMPDGNSTISQLDRSDDAKVVEEINQADSTKDTELVKNNETQSTTNDQSIIHTHTPLRKNSRMSDSDVFDNAINRSLSVQPTTEIEDFKNETVRLTSNATSQKDSKASLQNRTKHITMLLQKNCTGRNLIPNTIAVLSGHMLSLLTSGDDNINVSAVGCHTFVHLKFAVETVKDDILRQATEILSANVTLGNDYKIVKAYASEEDSDTSDVLDTLLFGENRHLEPFRLHGEMIAYIVASFCCTFVVLLFVILCCVRCFGTRQTNSLELCDIPHLNLKLEDYKIMPIPRPSISYNDYGRELLNSTYGGSRSGDTLGSHQKYVGDNSSSLGNTLRREALHANHELRSFNGKRQCTRVQSLDIHPHKNVTSWVNDSREKLKSEFERKRLSGIDNASFEKW